jgi:hypothetical protein
VFFTTHHEQFTFTNTAFKSKCLVILCIVEILHFLYLTQKMCGGGRLTRGDNVGKHQGHYERLVTLVLLTHSLPYCMTLMAGYNLTHNLQSFACFEAFKE